MRVLFLLIILFSSGFVRSQSDITSKVSDALKRGDAATLSNYFMDQVEVTLPTEEGTYGKAQAKTFLSGFFSQHTPKDFIVKHQGTSKLDDQYRIGDLVTSAGNYRVTFFMKNLGNDMKIKEIKIEPTGN
ncbi:MAG: DUF4783 domain-containing protein [Crocinitomicaceae bacterium]|nr:DUF4783 domain-containing protein [Crocinitomicaceae bacterium]